jgi:hypothetical protein
LKRITVILLIVLVNIASIPVSLSQNKPGYKNYNQREFDTNKIADQVYNLWKSGDNWFSKSKDSISYFVDDRNYKGIVNYGVTFRSKNFRNFNFVEYLSMCFLKVEISTCSYNPKDNSITIEGYVTGNSNWGSNEFMHTKKQQDYVHIYLGEKTDTIKACYLGKIVNRDSVEVKWNRKETNAFTVLDKFPAFYFKTYAYSKIKLERRHPFKISGKITAKTWLAFGSGSNYSEIFDLGSMIYQPNKKKAKNSAERKEPDCKPVITNNRLLADIEKENTQKEEVNYYTYTKNAENYILARQYARAKEEYNTLSQKYPVLFARDIHNAIRCAILSRDLKTAFGWSEKLALKGVELPYFNAKIFTSMRKNPEWKNFSTKYDSICKGAKGNWNLKLLKELDDLLQEDQSVYGLENRKNPKVLYETTERVTDKLIDLLKKEGYPSEEKTGCYVVNDTTLLSFPDFNVLMLHAEQQKTKNLDILKELLDQSSNALEYDRKRDFNSDTGYNSCFHIYKGNLYSSKSCGRNDAEIRKISFKFNNPNGFIMDYNNFVIEAYNSRNHKETDDYYKKNYNLIMKLSEDWEFYEK